MEPKDKAAAEAAKICREFKVVESVMEGKSLTAIGLELGVSATSVRAMLSRAIHKRLTSVAAGEAVPKAVWDDMNVGRNGFKGYHVFTEYWRARMANYVSSFNKANAHLGVAIE